MPSIRTLSLLLIAAVAGTATADEKITYEDHVKPILRQKCFSCHSTNKKTSDLDLSTYTTLMQGGASGAAIEPGNAENSYLFNVVNHDIEPYMPPESDRLPDEMLATIRKWIDAGAPETASSKVMLPKKPAVSLTVDGAADARPEGPPPLPDVLNLSPVVHTEATTAVPALATSPWAKLVAVAGQKQVLLYSSETLQPLGVLPFPEGQARVLKFSRNGALLLAGGGHGASRGLAVVWSIRTGERVIEVGDELDEVLAADISSDQMFVALGGPGKVVRVYSTQTGEIAYEVTKHTDWIHSLEFSPDGVLLATADRSGGLFVWEAFTGREYLNLVGHKGAVDVVSWRIDSNVLASASADRSVKLWEMEGGGNIKSWDAHVGGVSGMEFVRDGRIVTCGRDRVAKLWDQNGTQLLAFEALGDLALQVTHCDETNRVIAGDWTGEVRVWNAADGTRIGSLSTNPPPLEERLNVAETALPGLQQQLAAGQQAVAAATAEREAHVQQLDAARQAHATAQATLAEQQTKLQTVQQQLLANQQQITTAKARVAALQQALPGLKSAAEQATKAAELVPADAELKALAEQLNTQATARADETTQTEATLVTADAAVVEQQKSVETLAQQVQQSEQQVAASTALVEQRTAALAPLDEKLAAATAQHAAAEAAANNGIADIDRWKHYIALRDELELLNQRQTSLQEVRIAVLESEAELNEARQNIEAAEQSIVSDEQHIKDAKQQLESLSAELAANEQQRTEHAEQAAKHEQALPALQVAVEQIDAVATTLPDDADIKQSAEALARAVAGQQQQLNQRKQTLAETDAKIQHTKAAQQAATESIAVAEQKIRTTQQSLPQLMAATLPLEQRLTEAQAQLTAVEAEFSKAEAIVEARREKLRPQLQMIQAAR